MTIYDTMPPRWVPCEDATTSRHAFRCHARKCPYDVLTQGQEQFLMCAETMESYGAKIQTPGGKTSKPHEVETKGKGLQLSREVHRESSSCFACHALQ